MSTENSQDEDIRHLKVDREASGQRVDAYVASQIEGYSRTQIARSIKEGHLTINGKLAKANYHVRAGDQIRIALPVWRETTVEPENIPLDIVYEDDDLLVINKPAGMVTHPGVGNRSGTLVNALMYHCRNLSEVGGPERPGIVHRLDKGTSGLLVAVKNESAHRELANQLKDKTLFREYIAFAWGHLKDSSGTWDLPIGRSVTNPLRMRVDHGAGREAQTEYEVLKRYELCEKLRLRLKTGRTHQIRVHLSHFNHAVFGDPEYSGRDGRVRGIAPELRLFANRLLDLIDRPALHAARLGFTHPRDSRPMEFAVDPPEDMRRLEQALAEGSGVNRPPPRPPDIPYNYMRG